MAKKTPATTITRNDLEARFAGFQEGLRGKVESKKSTLITAVSVGSVVLMLIVYLLGRRSGKRKTTVVEIRRV
jgi:membrane protein DedA with SNARE-associated domain